MIGISHKLRIRIDQIKRDLAVVVSELESVGTCYSARLRDLEDILSMVGITGSVEPVRDQREHLRHFFRSYSNIRYDIGIRHE